jgi:phosphate transport system substrate-binding protein
VPSTSSRRLAALAVAAALTIGACAANAGGPTGTGSNPASDAPTGVTGSIAVSGSSTVEPISTGVAEELRDANTGFDNTIEGPGTGDGFQRFCAGETDISDASRKIKAEGEADVCAANGVDYVELQIAYDGITVMTSPDNAIDCLSYADLYALVGPESTGLTTWDAAQPLAAELGSTVTFPAASLDITGPGEESGTFDSFVELVIAGIAEDRGQDETTRPDYVASANDNAIIEGITGSSSSLGWVGFAFAEENRDAVHEIAISKEPGGECVAPTTESIADGTYPISRSLYLYVNVARAADNPAVAAYVDYYLAEGTIASVLEFVPYVNLPADKLAETRATWDSRPS